MSLRERTRLKLFIKKLIKAEGGELSSLNYIFCNNKKLLKINQEFLGHDDYTDIITFNLSPDPQIIEGEVYISVDRVRENARIFKSPLKEELLRVVFHGALHLCGYRDKNKVDIKEMRKAEDRWLSEFK